MVIKKISTVLSVFILFAVACFGQQDEVVFLEQPQAEVETKSGRETSINVGVLMGGGSLIGADLELLVGKRTGLQLGVGIRQYGLRRIIFFLIAAT